MKRLYIGLLLITSFLCARSQKVKRFSGNEQRGSNEWSWSRSEQLTDGQNGKDPSQPIWPNKGNNGGSTKGRGDASPNRDGSWGSDGWSSGENRKDMGWNMEPQGNNKGSAYPDGNDDQGGNLETLLKGVPGMDFPDFLAVPETAFDCSSMPSQGYYGDVEAGCQVFHICQPGNRKDSFLCPVGTIFNQKYFVCDWWFNVNCSDTPSYYDLNNEVYKDPVAVTEAVPVTTEKTLPWNSQDLDKKRPTKSWGNQPSMGKQNTRWNDTPNRRGSKSDSVATSREVSNSWSRSDVQQKEVTVAWGSSSGTPSGSYGSSSTSSSSVVPTTKPIWYGIDGQPSKDQSNGMSKRTGLVQTPAPFGTRMKSSTRSGRANTWASTEVYEPTTPPLRSVSALSSRNWLKGDDTPDMPTNGQRDSTYGPSSTTKGWLKNEVTAAVSSKGAGNHDGNYGYSTTKGWLKNDVTAAMSNSRAASQDGNYGSSATRGWLKVEDIPETSINPTGVDGVWEQESTRRSDEKDHTTTNALGHKGFVTKPDYLVNDSKRKYQTASNQGKEWGKRQAVRNTQGSTASSKSWIKQNFEKRKLFENSNPNSIARRKSWK